MNHTLNSIFTFLVKNLTRSYSFLPPHISDLSISQSYLDLTKSPQDVKDFENKLEFLLQEKKLQKRSIRQVDVTITGGEEQTSQQDG